MTTYLLRRLLQAIPTLIGVTIISFIIMQAAPGDPVQLLTFDPNYTAEDRRRIASEFCLDRPVFTQYLIWVFGDFQGQCKMRGLIRGDFGTSFFDRRPALDMILERIPATLELTTTALIIGATLGIAIGVASAIKRGSLFDNVARFFSVVFDALPPFWFGLLMIMLFAVSLGWLPVNGRLPLNKADITLWDRVRHLIMPSIVLAVSWVALMSRYMRAETLEVIRQDYVRTAHAKGLSPQRVYFWHAGRNALIAVATFMGPAIAGLITGAVVIEKIFSWPGMGRLLVDSLSARDYPLVMGGVIMGSVLVILGNLLSDVFLVIVDPRIRLE